MRGMNKGNIERRREKHNEAVVSDIKHLLLTTIAARRKFLA